MTLGTVYHSYLLCDLPSLDAHWIYRYWNSLVIREVTLIKVFIFIVGLVRPSLILTTYILTLTLENLFFVVR
jgi:hypothetical protein